MKFKIPYLTRLLEIKETQLTLEFEKIQNLEGIRKQLYLIIKGLEKTEKRKLKSLTSINNYLYLILNILCQQNKIPFNELSMIKSKQRKRKIK